MSNNSSWVMVGDLEKSFTPENNTLPQTPDLAGRTVRLTADDGSQREYFFETADVVVWQQQPDMRRACARYLATSLREAIYFVDFITDDGEAKSESLVLDLGRHLYTSVTARMPTQAQIDESLFRRAASGRELTAVDAAIVSGTIEGGAGQLPLHHPTEELVGKRVMYTYSNTERYEHIYLNPRFYTWHCLEGVEKGLADTDRCHYVKVDHNLYLFVWREKIIPTIGVVMVDLDRMKTTGKILGYEGQKAGTLSNFPVGAQARLLNVTSYA